MNELEFNCLLELLEDDFEGDYSITRTELLGLLKRAKWNAKVMIKNELEEAKGQALAQQDKMRVEGSGSLTTKPYPDRYQSEQEFKGSIAHPEQEPYLYAGREHEGYCEVFPLYRGPPKREWVGLTDADIKEGADLSRLYRDQFEPVARWAEAKLKEKNHGAI